ncbi:hypothetical protein AMECASPLE_034334, partial [Ameca splendens]
SHCGRCSPEVQCHLHYLEWVKLQVVLTAPVHQLMHLLSVCRLMQKMLLSLTCCCWLVRKLVIHQQVGELLSEDVWVYGVQGRAEVYKQDPGIHSWVVKVVQEKV